jgi:hypothetical protein
VYAVYHFGGVGGDGILRVSGPSWWVGILHGGDFGLRWPTAGWVKDVAAIAGADAGSHREPGLRCLSHCSTLPRPVSAEIEDQE